MYQAYEKIVELISSKKEFVVVIVVNAESSPDSSKNSNFVLQYSIKVPKH